MVVVVGVRVPLLRVCTTTAKESIPALSQVQNLETFFDAQFNFQMKRKTHNIFLSPPFPPYIQMLKFFACPFPFLVDPLLLFFGS